jgi:hypothetical protein
VLRNLTYFCDRDVLDLENNDAFHFRNIFRQNAGLKADYERPMKKQPHISQPLSRFIGMDGEPLTLTIARHPPFLTENSSLS